MAFTTIISERRGAVTVITLNRPEKLNAWTHRMRDELFEAMDTANADPAVGAIVLTGAGRGFCAGADIGGLFKKQLDDGGGKSRERADGKERRDWVAAVRQSKPMIAAVNGACIGIGLTQILPFDYIIASEKAKFCCAFVKMGVVTELASSHFLVQRLGFGKASELALSARTIDGAEAVALGLADRLTAPDDLLDVALEVAARIAENPDRQLRMVKELLTRNGTEPDLDLVQTRELDLLDICYASPEHAEAVNAFLEKRPAKFR
jgi:enoyl-CoA hydratase/carnithine racemase